MVTNPSTRKVMAASDIRRISVQRRGAIFMLCVVRKTGEVDILGFALGVGRRGVRVHGAIGGFYMSEVLSRSRCCGKRVGYGVYNLSRKVNPSQPYKNTNMMCGPNPSCRRLLIPLKLRRSELDPLSAGGVGQHSGCGVESVNHLQQI